MSTTATPDTAAWPHMLPAPLTLLAWLDEETKRLRQQPEALRILAGFRWLVLAEVDRTAPEPPPKCSDLIPISHT